MAITRKQEERALSTDERELVEKSRPPALRSLTDAQLATLVKRMRVGRDKARTVAERQRREMRGKATARGAKPVAGRRRIADQAVGPVDGLAPSRHRDGPA